MSESERLKAFQDSSRIHSPESGFLAQKSYVPPLYTNLHCQQTAKKLQPWHPPLPGHDHGRVGSLIRSNEIAPAYRRTMH